MREFFSRIIASFESRKQPLVYWLFSLLAVVLLRMYLEDYSSGVRGSRGFFNVGNQLHEALFFVLIFLFIIILLSWFTREDFRKIGKIVVAFSWVILLPPLVDLAITAGRGLYISYVYDFEIQNFLVRFLTLGGTWQGGGATPGVKVEFVFVLAMLATYVYLKSRRVWKAVAAPLVFYGAMSALAVLPWLLQRYYAFFGISEEVDHMVLGNKLFMLLVLALIFLLVWRSNRGAAWLVLQQLRWSRIVFYSLVFTLGLAVSVQVYGWVGRYPDLVLDYALSLVAIMCSSLFVMMVNDFEDRQIDTVSSPWRLLPAGSLAERSYRLAGYGALAGALLAAAAVSLETFFLILLGNALFVVYSVPPFKLKRRLVISKIVIAAASVIIMTAGFLLNGTNCSAFLPSEVLLSLALGVLTGSFVIDLKDRAGDRANGTATLPVVLGDRRARVLIAALLVIVFGLVTWAFDELNSLPYSLLLGLICGLTLFPKKWREIWTFLAYFLSLLYFAWLYLR